MSSYVILLKDIYFDKLGPWRMSTYRKLMCHSNCGRMKKLSIIRVQVVFGNQLSSLNASDELLIPVFLQSDWTMRPKIDLLSSPAGLNNDTMSCIVDGEKSTDFRRTRIHGSNKAYC
jgi:hypothetical protein